MPSVKDHVSALVYPFRNHKVTVPNTGSEAITLRSVGGSERSMMAMDVFTTSAITLRRRGDAHKALSADAPAKYRLKAAVMIKSKQDVLMHTVP